MSDAALSGRGLNPYAGQTGALLFQLQKREARAAADIKHQLNAEEFDHRKHIGERNTMLIGVVTVNYVVHRRGGIVVLLL